MTDTLTTSHELMMINALRWNCTGRQITRGICWALRQRTFAQADAPVVEVLV